MPPTKKTVDTARNENLPGLFRRAQNRRRNPGLLALLETESSVAGMDMIQVQARPLREGTAMQSLSRSTGSCTPLANVGTTPALIEGILIGTVPREYQPALKVAIGHFRWKPAAGARAGYSRVVSRRLCSMA